MMLPCSIRIVRVLILFNAIEKLLQPVEGKNVAILTIWEEFVEVVDRFELVERLQKDLALHLVPTRLDVELLD